MHGKWFATWHSLGWKWIFDNFWPQKICGKNRSIPFPVNPQMIVTTKENILFDLDDLNNFQNFGSYFQCYEGKIKIGKGTFIAGNVGLITQNHDVYDLNKHTPAENITIGDSCWIGMNCVLLPGTTRGNNTVVGAGSVVTKSFPDGHCMIAGNPAKKIKDLN